MSQSRFIENSEEQLGPLHSFALLWVWWSLYGDLSKFSKVPLDNPEIANPRIAQKPVQNPQGP